MADYVTLLGAKDVAQAGRDISRAAETIAAWSNYLQHGLEQHQRWMEDWLIRLEAALEKHAERMERKDG